MTVGQVLTSPAPVRLSSRAPYAVVAGLAVLLVTWIFVVPPFGGTDEFDHAYRAAATAEGQWAPTPSDATRGTGAWVDVPQSLVAAARPECQARVYTTDADCVGTVQGSSVRIATGAGRYHPLFYAYVGAVASPFHGTAALYAMRVATAGLALGLVGLALLAFGTWVRSRTAYTAVAIAFTPMVVYSCAIVAPNGIEMAAALAFWAAAVGLLVADTSHLRRLAVVATVSGILLCTLRPLGPLWCLLSALAVYVAVRSARGRLRALLVRRDIQVGAVLVFLSALQSAIWAVSMGALRLGQTTGEPIPTSVAHRVGEALPLLPLWVLQAIAAFPMRDDATHPLVYPCYLVLFGILVVTALRVADRRVRLAVAGIAVVALAFPFASTVNSYDTVGAAWQGRYALPLLFGLVVLSAYALDLAGRSLPGPWPVYAGVLFVLCQVLSAAYTLHVEIGRSPLVHSSAWPRPALWLVVVCSAAGAALLWWSAASWRTAEEGAEAHA